MSSAFAPMRVQDAHYPPAPPGALNRAPRPRTKAEAQFLAIGTGAGLWLAGAAAAGAARVRSKMAQAVQMAALHGTQPVDRAAAQSALQMLRVTLAETETR